jgi:hypothetical protein
MVSLCSAVTSVAIHPCENYCSEAFNLTFFRRSEKAGRG